MGKNEKISINAVLFVIIIISTSVVNASESFTFAVIGDRTGRERQGFFEKQVVESLNLLGPEFVVNAGDNIHGYTEDVNTINQQWDAYDISIKKLQMPFYRTVGNHDITNEVMLKVYQSRYKRTYYHYLFKDVLFLFVNTEDPPADLPEEIKSKLHSEIKGIRRRIKTQGYTEQIVEELKAYEEKSLNTGVAQISDEQVEYFADVLKKNKDVRWTFVLMHKRAWKQKEITPNWLKIENLLAGREYTVFAGHEHMHEYAIRNGHDYIGLGTAGGGWLFPDTVAGIYDHVLFVTVGDGEPVICNILLNGIFNKSTIPVVGK